METIFNKPAYRQQGDICQEVSVEDRGGGTVSLEDAGIGLL